MGSFVSYWFVALMVVLLLSIACAAGLIFCWHESEPKAFEGEVTATGKFMVRARLVFTTACGIVFACPIALCYLSGAQPGTQAVQLFELHPQSVPLILLLSVGLSGASWILALNSGGDGRRALLIAISVVAVLTFCAALFLFQALSH